MPYTKRIVCLANSEKYGGSCVAGRELLRGAWGPWIRPVSDRPTGELSFIEQCYSDHSSPILLDILEVHLLTHQPHFHQTENHVIDRSKPWRKVGILPFDRLHRLVETPTSLWSQPSGPTDRVSESEAAKYQRSLYFLKVAALIVRIRNDSGRRRYTGIFQVGHQRYELHIKDSAFYHRYRDLPSGKHQVSSNANIHLCISLGEPYKGYCYKLIAAVITDPPL